MTRVGILGLGRLGQALGAQLRKSKEFRVSATVRNPKRARDLHAKWKISVTTDNAELVRTSDVVILAVKPHQAQKVLQAVAGKFRKSQILVSVCASIQHRQLAHWSKGRPKIVRAMPNLPSFISEGMTVLCPGETVEKADLNLIQKIFAGLGRVMILDEAHMDSVTALSACGPAFIFTIIESLIEAGVKTGLPRDATRELVLQTMVGSALMVQRSRSHPAELKDQVTTPAGCTIDGLQKLEEGRLRATLIQAVLASAKRSAALRRAK